MGKKINFIYITSIFMFILCSCNLIGNVTTKGNYKINNLRIYQNTPVWDLALAVNRQNARTIEKISRNQPNLLNYQDPKYGATLLLWAVGMEKYKSAEALLKCGADPDIPTNQSTTYGGTTPLFLASGFSWIDNDAKKDPQFIKLLLNYGADPNKCYDGFNVSGSKPITEPGSSPLMNSIMAGIEKTKALVEAGADINYKTKRGGTAAIEALLLRQNPEYAYYLIVEKKAKVSEAYYRRESYGNEDPNEKFYPVTLLRYWIFDLDSKEYKMKMEIVEEFARQGVNYWETKPYNDTIEQIRKLYPKNWEEYLKKY